MLLAKPQKIVRPSCNAKPYWVERPDIAGTCDLLKV